MMSQNRRRYSELIQLPTYEDRLRYLQIGNTVGIDTFGFDRYMNQKFYKSKEWTSTRNYVIIRDCGCDLALPEHDIFELIVVHHIMPISKDDIIYSTDLLLDPENLITVSDSTHKKIHYRQKFFELDTVVNRFANDTCPWK